MNHLNLSQGSALGTAKTLLATAAVGMATLSPSAVSAQTGPAPGQPVAVIVRVATPWYAPRFVVTGKMRETIPQYANTPGLAFKAFSFERQSGDFGGIYLWKDKVSAQAWFNNDWFARVKRERGADASVRMFDTPIAIDNTPGGTPGDGASAAVATLVEIAIPAGISQETIDRGFREAIPTYQKDISSDAHRQRLTRSRAKLDAFAGSSCGLASESAKCQCDKQIPAVRHVRASSAELPPSVVAIHRTEREEVQRNFDSLVRLGNASAMIKAHPDYQAPEFLRLAIRSVLSAEGFLAGPPSLH